ncbi:MAG: lipopolysaccharide biosynthesis protein [Bosea sp. (in: a-proteobacteria)]
MMMDYLRILSGSAGRLVVSLVYFLIVANTLSLADFGLFATASATGLILSRLLAFGFVSPVYRTATVRPRLLGAYMGGFWVLMLASLPVIALLGWLIFQLLFTGRISALAFTCILLAEIVGWRLVELVSIINNGLGRFGKASLLVIIGSSLRTLAAIAFWFSGLATLEAWAFAYLAATVTTAILAFATFMPSLRLRFVARLYGRRMSDAMGAAAAEIGFYAQSELDKLLVLAVASPTVAGLYAIAMRVVDLTAMPVRSFNQMAVQALMKDGGAISGRRKRALTELGIALVSIAGLVAIVALLWMFPNALGRNIGQAGHLLALMLAVPAFRNLIEYHAELLYAHERIVARIALLTGLALLKAALLWWLLKTLPAPESWSLWLNGVFALLYLVSATVAYRVLGNRKLPQT